MTAAFELHHEIDGGVRFYRLVGEFDDERLIRAIVDSWKLPDYDPTLPEIYDARLGEGPGITFQGLVRQQSDQVAVFRDESAALAWVRAGSDPN